MGKKQWKKTTAWMLTAAVCIGSVPVIPGSTAKAAEDAATENGFVLYDGQSTAPVLMDAAYADSEEDAHAERSYEQVKRAVGDFRQDVAMVTGAVDATEVQQIMNDSEELQEERLEKADQKKVPELYTGDYGQVKEDYAVLVGTIGDSEMIDTLIGDGKLDEAKTIEGNWESYVIKEVENPLPGVEKGLVIAGSDARGTIYGIYEISENIGVSPFYWYSDVPVETKEEIVVDDYETAAVNDGPDVKYRGIFINDEDISILNWAAKKFEDNEAPGLHYYRHVFELMLRLKCNFLWPAMHEVSDAFNTATDENGIPVDSKEAARYGIVMGSSHCEILLRANTSEWAGWYAKNKDKYQMQGNNASEAYDFSRNEEGILQYWRERLETNKDFESILTLGIRGVHDGAFRCANLSKYEGSTNAEKKVSFMKDVIKKQRQLIAEVYLDGDMSRIAEVPQVLIPYKEMGTVYNDGLNKFMAQEEYRDVTLMWAEDNFGYVRQVPTSDEASRSGGTGIYYHSSYWGTPSCYLWLNSTPLAQLSEELHKAYDAGMRNQWVLNVGDIKPGDQALEFYAKMAWDMESYDDKTVKENFRIPQAMRDYHMDQQTAEEVADCMEEYNSIIAVKKPEFYTIAGGAYPMSATADGDEALKWLQRCQKVTDRMTAVYEKLAPEYQTAFYEQMYYHVLSMNDAAREYVFYWKAQQAAKQGRLGSQKIYIQLSKAAAATIRARVEDYNSLNNNKWAGYMSWKHVASSGSEDYSHDIIQTSEYPALCEAGEGAGAAAEGMETAGSGTLSFDSLSGDVRYFDVFSKQTGSVSWCAKTSADWIRLSRTQGSTATEERVTVEVDWSKVSGTQSGTITVYNVDADGKEQGNAVATFEVKAENRSGFDYGNQKGYTEANGYVMLEAEHYSQQITGSDGSSWEVIKNNGQRGDTMKAMPNTAAYTEDYANTAKLVYHVYFKKAGTVNGTLYRLPTLNEGTDDNGTARTCRIGIGTGNETPVVLKGNSGWQEMYSYNNPSNTWAQNIMRMYEPLDFTLKVSEGWNDIVLYRMNAAMVVDRILLRTESDAVKASLQGPDESPNNITDRAAVSVAAIPAEVADAIFHADMKVNVADGKTAYTENIKATAASSAEKRVAEAEVKDGKVFVIPKMAGKAEITVTTESETFTFEVTVEPDKNAEGAYKETNGQAVMLAGDALAQSGEAFTVAGTGNHTFGLSGIGIKVQPDNGATWTDGSMSGLSGKAPAATYKVQISTAGTYRLYVNTSNPDANADSYHLAVDGNFVYTDKNDSGGGTATGKETWYGGNQTINLTAGVHTITIFAREDGFTLNQLCLTTGNKPSGLFEKSSERVAAEIPDDVSVKVEAENAYQLSDGMTLDGVWEDAGASSQKWLKTAATKEQAAVQITVEIPKDGMYHIETRYRADASGRATLQTTADAKKVGNPFSMKGTSGTYATADCGSISLTRGTHTISYKVADDAGTTIGLDYVVLTRTGDAKEEPVVSPDTGYEVLVKNETQTFTDGTKDNTASAVRFPAEVQKQDAVEVSFDWTSKITTGGGKAGLTFRDAYGRLIFAVGTAYKTGFELRYATDGGRLDDEKIADWYEPVWNSVAATADTVYTIHLKADFTNQVLSYDITEKASGRQMVKAENVQMDAADLAAMTACSYYTSGGSLKTAQQVENFVIKGTKEKELPLKGKTLYAFGDSIVHGHVYGKASFPNFVAAMEGMTFTNTQKFAVNGATILSSNNQILNQIRKAPEEAPDYVIFEGGINDAYDTLKEAEFTAAFEETLQAIKDKWPTAKILYVAVHKTNTREAAYQETVHRLALASCEKMQVKVADLYTVESYDCLNYSENVKKYAFDALGKNGLPMSKGSSATHPNLDAIEAFYVPVVSEALRNLAEDTEKPDPDEGDKDAAERAEAAAKAAQEAADVASAAAKTAESTKAEAVKAAGEAKAAKEEAEAAKAAAETAKAAAEKAKQDAETAKTAADADKAAAEATAQRAESAEAAAKAAQEKAETAQTKAEAAKTAAQTAKANAETAENNAKTAQGKAETAANAAKDAKEAAELAKTDAETAKTKAEEAQQKAETARDAAVNAKEAAEEAKGKAEAAAAEAKEAKEAAEAAGTAAKAQADLAKAYADAAEASAEKAIASAEAAKSSAGKAEEAYKKAEEKLAQVQKEAEEKIAALEKLLETERFQKQKAKIKKVNAGKGKLQVSWKVVEGADGYVIEYAQKANFKGKKQIVVKNGSRTSQKISKLKKKKTYYVRIKAYRENGTEKVYTRFSAKKKVRTK